MHVYNAQIHNTYSPDSNHPLAAGASEEQSTPLFYNCSNDNSEGKRASNDCRHDCEHKAWDSLPYISRAVNAEGNSPAHNLHLMHAIVRMWNFYLQQYVCYTVVLSMYMYISEWILTFSSGNNLGTGPIFFYEIVVRNKHLTVKYPHIVIIYTKPDTLLYSCNKTKHCLNITSTLLEKLCLPERGNHH